VVDRLQGVNTHNYWEETLSSNLAGSWKLVSFNFEFEDGEKVQAYADGQGSLIITAERFSAIVSDNSRKLTGAPASFFEGMMAYTGLYSVEGNAIVVNVDVAWHPAWVGSKQIRYFTIEDDELSIVSAVQEHPKHPGRKGRGVIYWRRES
jgi:Lipocalin-like domain